MKAIISVFFLIILTSCAAKSTARLEAEPIQIDGTELPNYWQSEFAKREMSLQLGKAGKKQCHSLSRNEKYAGHPFVVYQFLIDSQGEIHDREYVAISEDSPISTPMLSSKGFAEMIIGDQTYIPAASNQNNIPVRVQQKVYIMSCDRYAARLN